MYQFVNSLDTLMFQKKGRSRAINQENPTGEKGRGGMAASELGPSRKGAPCIRGIAPGDTAYFHAQWRRERLTELKRDYTILDGDDQYPTICGTGTEDYFGGSWSFASVEDGVTVEHTYNTPFMGYPYFSREDKTVFNPYHMNDKPTERGFYRWHIMDPILFEQDIRVTIQQIGVCHKGLFERQDDVSSVAYWYQSEPHQAFKKLPGREERWPR